MVQHLSTCLNPCMVFGSVGPVYYTLRTGPTDPNLTQGLTNVVLTLINNVLINQLTLV